MSSRRMLVDYLREEVPEPDPDFAARFARLAQETTGKTQRIMLKLAAGARSEAAPAPQEAGGAQIIELHLVPRGASGADRTYG